ncbi:MAG TPA: hypothetical protein ENI86_12470 [Acidimicrobiales bacterium]|nr:hypothetical protein [Acidimicrobiales bacterium]
MWILAAALPVGALVALLAGGTFSDLLKTRVRLWPLLVVALGLSTWLTFVPDPPAENFLLPAALTLFLAVAVANIGITGATVVAVGILANLVPVVLNGGLMPVRAEALVDAGLATPDTVNDVVLGGGRAPAESRDLLEPLTAIIPVKPVHEVFTFGDLIVTIGLLDLGFRLVKPRSERRRSSGSETDIDLRDQVPETEIDPWLTPPEGIPVPRREPPTVQTRRPAAPVPTSPERPAPPGRVPPPPTEIRPPRTVSGSATWGSGD